MPRRGESASAMRLESGSPDRTPERKRAAAKPGPKAERKISRAQEAKERAGSASGRFDSVAKAMGKTKGETAASWIAARRDQIVSDTVASDSKDVSGQLQRRMEMTALAAKMTPDQTLALRAYLDGLDAVDAGHAKMNAAKRQDRKTNREPDFAPPVGFEAQGAWARSRDSLTQLEQAVRDSGIDLDQYDFARKSSREAMRGERLGLRDLIPKETAAIKAYVDILDATDRAHVEMTRAAKAAKKESKGVDNAAWEQSVLDGKRIAAQLERMGISPASPEFATKAARAQLKQEVPGLLRESERPMSMDEYDVPRNESAKIVTRDAPDVKRVYAAAPAMQEAIVSNGFEEADARTERSIRRHEKFPVVVEDDELEVIDLQADIRENLARIDAMVDPAEMNRLDREIQQQAAEWAKIYMGAHPNASIGEVMADLETAGVGDYIGEKDIARMKNGVPVERLFAMDGKTEIGLKSRKAAEARMHDARYFANSQDMGTDIPANEWEDATTIQKTGGSGRGEADTRFARTIVQRNERAAGGEYGSDEWIASGSHEPAPESPGFMQRISQSGFGRWARRGMLALGLLGAGKATVDAASHIIGQDERKPVATLSVRDDVAATPDGSVVGATEEMEAVEYVPTKSEVTEKRLVRKPGDVRNLEDALRIMDMFPSKEEYGRMQAKERAAQTKAALEDLKVIRSVLSGPSPAVEASKRIDAEAKQEELRQKLDAARDFYELKRTIRNL